MGSEPSEADTLAEALDWAKWLTERSTYHYGQPESNERRIIALAKEVHRLRSPRAGNGP